MPTYSQIILWQDISAGHTILTVISEWISRLLLSNPVLGGRKIFWWCHLSILFIQIQERIDHPLKLLPFSAWFFLSTPNTNFRRTEFLKSKVNQLLPCPAHKVNSGCYETLKWKLSRKQAFGAWKDPGHLSTLLFVWGRMSFQEVDINYPKSVERRTSSRNIVCNLLLFFYPFACLSLETPYLKEKLYVLIYL